MLRTLCAYRGAALRSLPACSTTHTVLRRLHGGEHSQRENTSSDGGTSGDSEGSSSRSNRSGRRSSRWWTRARTYGYPLMGFSIMTSIKDLFGIKPFALDDDPIKDKIKRAWLLRRHRKYEEAEEILHDALGLAEERKIPIVITRVYDEMANLYYEMGKLDEAERLFRALIHRLLELHGKSDNDKEFIGISLKLANIFAMKGEVENAETGYRHCITKQMTALEASMKKHLVKYGAHEQTLTMVEDAGAPYTDPIALFGQCLEQFAYFLINYRDESRLPECEQYMDEVLKISYQLFGPHAAHSINLLNNFGAALVLKNRFELARKYLAIGAERIIHVNECSDILPGYLCNYAEALFHCGEKDQALKVAEQAVLLSASEEPRIQEHARKFLADLKKDMKKGGRTRGWLF